MTSLKSNDLSSVFAYLMVLFVFNKGMKLTQSQISDFLSNEISSYKKPKKIHTVKNLPRNNNRKIDRNFLKKNWKNLIIK